MTLSNSGPNSSTSNFTSPEATRHVGVGLASFGPMHPLLWLHNPGNPCPESANLPCRNRWHRSTPWCRQGRRRTAGASSSACLFGTGSATAMVMESWPSSSRERDRNTSAIALRHVIFQRIVLEEISHGRRLSAAVKAKVHADCAGSLNGLAAAELVSQRGGHRH